MRPSSGQAWIGEHDVWKEQAQVKRLIGVVPQRPNLDFSLTAREILTFHAAYFGIGSRQRNERADELLEKFKLSERASQMVRGFSGGMMQRLSIARAMMHDPQVLFLDEPSAGLDPQTRILLWEIIREYHQAGKTLLLTTHNMDEADALCQRLAIVDHGRVIALGTPAQLKASIPGGFVLRLRFGNQTPELFQRLQSLAGVRGRFAPRMDRVPTSMPIEAALSFPKSRAWLRIHLRSCLTFTFLNQVWKISFCTIPEGACAIELENLCRDAGTRCHHVARRNAAQLLLQTFLQPLLFVFVFGRVMVGSGYLPTAYRSLLLPGIIAITMVFTGVFAVAMPLIAEFQWSHEIEDRLLAPIDVAWVAIEKVISGMLQALVTGLVVIPLAWLLLRPGVEISIRAPLTFVVIIMLVAIFSACGGLVLGCTINQQHIGLMFGMVITPMIFFGCTYYPLECSWKPFPILKNSCTSSTRWSMPAKECGLPWSRSISAFINRVLYSLHCFSLMFCCWSSACASSRRRR